MTTTKPVINNLTMYYKSSIHLRELLHYRSHQKDEGDSVYRIDRIDRHLDGRNWTVHLYCFAASRKEVRQMGTAENIGFSRDVDNGFYRIVKVEPDQYHVPQPLRS